MKILYNLTNSDQTPKAEFRVSWRGTQALFCKMHKEKFESMGTLMNELKIEPYSGGEQCSFCMERMR